MLGFDTTDWSIDRVYDLDLLLGADAKHVKTLTDLDSDDTLFFELGAGRKGFAVLDLVDPYSSRTGTDGDDDLLGSSAGEFIQGLGGNDIIRGLGRNDHLHGNSGRDQLFGGTGDDRLLGGTGADQLFGGADDDTLSGGRGDDLLWGGDGVDLLHGGRGADSLSGGKADDILRGGADDDHLDGQAGNDDLAGGAGNDSLHGGAGRDILRDGDGRDEMTGGAVVDHFVLRADGDLDRILDFVQGRDLIDLADWNVTPFGRFDIDYAPDGQAVISYGDELLVVAFADGTARPFTEDDFLF